VEHDLTKPYVPASNYTLNQQRILAASDDDIDLEVSLETYERMEREGTITKAKTILITSVLSDDLQMAPGATEDETSEKDYEWYVKIQQFSERVICGLDKPYRDSMEQLLGNGIRYGHGIAESEWDYRLDTEPPPAPDPADKQKAPKNSKSMWSKMGLWFGLGAEDPKPTVPDPSIGVQETRLMPTSIKVKPRGATRFVVDDFMNILGIYPVNRRYNKAFTLDEMIDRKKFLILTLNKHDEDPRGRSMYRAAFNWYNIKTQVPAELLRFILEEIVPKAIGKLPPDTDARPYEIQRDSDGNIIYEADGTTPKTFTVAESFKNQIDHFRSGSGAVIPNGADLSPYKKGMTGSSDADLFPKVTKLLDDQMENAILLQTLAQSEGAHQARSASEQVAEVLYMLVFWLKLALAMVTLYDLIAPAVEMNYGAWALKYLPKVSFGDFVNRNWVEMLKALSDGYFKGLIDDSQRAQLMAWMGLPKPGPSRQEQGLEALASQDLNGNPAPPPAQRPDKQAGTKNRNAGNGTEKKQNG